MNSEEQLKYNSLDREMIKHKIATGILRENMESIVKLCIETPRPSADILHIEVVARRALMSNLTQIKDET